MQRLERRLREGEHAALEDIVETVKRAIRRLSAGETAIDIAWPEPPPDLVPGVIEPLLRAQYVAEVVDRLAQIDEALGSAADPVDAASAVYRHVHTMKGAASAAGDEPMAWFCHGLEERLRNAASSRESATAALREVAKLSSRARRSARRAGGGARDAARLAARPPTRARPVRRSDRATGPSKKTRAPSTATPRSASLRRPSIVCSITWAASPSRASASRRASFARARRRASLRRFAPSSPKRCASSDLRGRGERLLLRCAASSAPRRRSSRWATSSITSPSSSRRAITRSRTTPAPRRSCSPRCGRRRSGACSRASRRPPSPKRVAPGVCSRSAPSAQTSRSIAVSRSSSSSPACSSPATRSPTASRPPTSAKRSASRARPRSPSRHASSPAVSSSPSPTTAPASTSRRCARARSTPAS